MWGGAITRCQFGLPSAPVINNLPSMRDAARYRRYMDQATSRQAGASRSISAAITVQRINIRLLRGRVELGGGTRGAMGRSGANDTFKSNTPPHLSGESQRKSKAYLGVS